MVVVSRKTGDEIVGISVVGVNALLGFSPELAWFSMGWKNI